MVSYRKGAAPLAMPVYRRAYYCYIQPQFVTMRASRLNYIDATIRSPNMELIILLDPLVVL